MRKPLECASQLEQPFVKNPESLAKLELFMKRMLSVRGGATVSDTLYFLEKTNVEWRLDFVSPLEEAPWFTVSLKSTNPTPFPVVGEISFGDKLEPHEQKMIHVADNGTISFWPPLIRGGSYIEDLPSQEAYELAVSCLKMLVNLDLSWIKID